MNTLSGSELAKEDTFPGDGSAMGAKDDDHPHHLLKSPTRQSPVAAQAFPTPSGKLDMRTVDLTPLEPSMHFVFTDATGTGTSAGYWRADLLMLRLSWDFLGIDLVETFGFENGKSGGTLLLDLVLRRRTGPGIWMA